MTTEQLIQKAFAFGYCPIVPGDDKKAELNGLTLEEYRRSCLPGMEQDGTVCDEKVVRAWIIDALA